MEFDCAKDADLQAPLQTQLMSPQPTSNSLRIMGEVLPSPTVSTLSTPYELTQSRFQVDLANLSLLTNFNVGLGTITALSADPGRLLSLFGYSQW